MFITGQEHSSCQKRLRLAREERWALCEDLADVAAAQRAAERALAQLGAGVDGEGKERARRLAGLLATLARARADIRQKLAAASGRMRRLEAQIAVDETQFPPAPAMRRA